MGQLIITNAEKKRFLEIAQETISGFLIGIKTSVAVTKANVDQLDSHILTLTRYMDGKKIREEFSLSLYQIYCIVYRNKQAYADGDFLTVSDTDNPSHLLAFQVGTNYVLKGGETFRLECTNAAFAAGTVDLTITTVPSIGLQSFVPYFEVQNLDSALTTYDLKLGSDVADVIFLQRGLNAAAAGAARHVVSKFDITSDKLTAEYPQDLIYMAAKSVPSGTTTYQGEALSLVATDNLLNNVRMKLTCDTTSAARQIIVVRKVQTPELINAFLAKTAQHQAENQEHVKSNDSHECNCKH